MHLGSKDCPKWAVAQAWLGGGSCPWASQGCLSDSVSHSSASWEGLFLPGVKSRNSLLPCRPTRASDKPLHVSKKEPKEGSMARTDLNPKSPSFGGAFLKT